MRIAFTTCLIILVCVYAFGQEKTKTADYYENKVKSKPFFLRWYWTIRGGSPYAWKETLLLKSDSSFTYSFQGGECGTFDHSGSGTWTKTNKELILRPNDNLYMLQKRYIVDKRKLYASLDSLNNRIVAFKKK